MPPFRNLKFSEHCVCDLVEMGNIQQTTIMIVEVDAFVSLRCRLHP